MPSHNNHPSNAKKLAVCSIPSELVCLVKKNTEQDRQCSMGSVKIQHVVVLVFNNVS